MPDIQETFTLPNGRRRYLKQAIFRFLTWGAVILCIAFLILLLGRMIVQGVHSFYHYQIILPVHIDMTKTDIKDPYSPSQMDLKIASYSPLIQDALITKVSSARSYTDKKQIFKFVSPEAAFQLRDYVLDNAQNIGTIERFAFDVASDVESYIKYYRDDLQTYNFENRELKTLLEHPATNLQKGYGVFITKGSFRKFIPEMPCQKEKKADKDVIMCDIGMTDKTFFIRVSQAYAKVNKIIFTKEGLETIYTTLMTPFEAALVNEIKNWSILKYDIPEARRKLGDLSLVTVEKFLHDGTLRSKLPNIPFFTNADSRNAEQAGIAGAFIGSVMTLIVCLICALPVGVAAAVYLEEFAPQNALTEFFEVNINNLASVPSIIYGLLGLALLLNFFELPRSSPLVGGIVLGIMSLPVMIISTRTALRTVPNATRDAALALGATKVQTFFDHTLPASIPGIMTGAVLSLSRAIGETAPLLLIGMVAFISDIPQNIADTATVLPVQIFLWTENPEIGYIERTAATIIVLLFLMVALNGCAIYLRNKFEQKY
ncbi:MAG: phosphate ABC transporter permease PstA [Pseudomonadota bacterium]